MRKKLEEAKKALKIATSNADDELLKATLDSKADTADDASEKAIDAAKRRIARRTATLMAKSDLADQAEAPNLANKRLAFTIDLKAKKNSLGELDKRGRFFSRQIS